jgi:hypothetical protein
MRSGVRVKPWETQDCGKLCLDKAVLLPPQCLACPEVGILAGRLTQTMRLFFLDTSSYIEQRNVEDRNEGVGSGKAKDRE